MSIPVKIYTAVDPSNKIHLNRIHKPSGKRTNYTKTVQDIAPVDFADIIKGHKIDKNIYVMLEAGEIDALKIDSKRTPDLQQFINVSEIEPMWIPQTCCAGV